MSAWLAAASVMLAVAFLGAAVVSARGHRDDATPEGPPRLRRPSSPVVAALVAGGAGALLGRAIAGGPGLVIVGATLNGNDVAAWKAAASG